MTEPVVPRPERGDRPPRWAQDFRGQALEIARGWSGPTAPASWRLTAALFEQVAADEHALEVAATIPADRLPALLVVAATVDLVGSLADPDLRRYFPSGSSSGAPIDGQFAPRLRAFWRTHRGELIERCRTHRYQMNEVARCTGLALALSVLGELTEGRAWTLIDLGTAAGFALHLDRYRYELSDGRTFGDLASSVVLACELEPAEDDSEVTALAGSLGPTPTVPVLPPLRQRIGIELEPVDLDDPAVSRWLHSCVPPEPASLGRFEAAVAVLRAHPTDIRRGDVLQLLPAVLEELRPSEPVVVTDAFAAVFFSEAERRALAQLVELESNRRDIAWISFDPLVPLGSSGRDSVQGLAVPSPLVERVQQKGVFGLLGLILHRAGERRSWVLGRAHPSGSRLTWLAQPTTDQVGPSGRSVRRTI